MVVMVVIKFLGSYERVLFEASILLLFTLHFGYFFSPLDKYFPVIGELAVVVLLGVVAKRVVTQSFILLFLFSLRVGSMLSFLFSSSLFDFFSFLTYLSTLRHASSSVFIRLL